MKSLMVHVTSLEQSLITCAVKRLPQQDLFSWSDHGTTSPNDIQWKRISDEVMANGVAVILSKISSAMVILATFQRAMAG